MECIFCKIVDKKISARIILETKKSIAFLDAFPLTRGHTLVIPKNHYVKVQDMNKDDNSDLFELVRILSVKMENLAPAALIAIHNGKESGQEIPHVHVHVIPRGTNDSVGAVHSMFKNRPTLSDNEFEELVKKLRDAN